MMKSFFKKLAFVMALAMVVSTAAPAGAAFAANAGIALQTAKSDAEILESDNIAVDAKVDYKFYGAPANWKKMGLKWTSSNEAVATVDQTGLVTGVADGVATIDLKSEDGSYAVSMKVVVGKGDQSYTYKQASHKVATFTFKQDVNYTVDDVVLTKVFGEYEVNWPIESFSCEKNVVAVAPYVDFADGDTYIIKIGAEDEGTTFTTTLGTVDFIQIAWESLDVEDVAYAKLDEDDEDIDVELSVKLFSNGVDVTAVADASSVEFELVNESDDYDMDDNILVFEKPGAAATVKAIYTYDDEEGEEQTVENFATVISQPAPKYTIVSVDKWTIAAAGEEIDWADDLTHSLPAFDDEEETYSIVLLMTDSYGNKIVYPNEFAADSELGDKTIYALSDITDDGEDAYIEAAEDFKIRYTSTNLNKIFVGTKDGEITTIGKSSAPVIISLYGEDDGEDVLLKNLFAAAVEITEERKPSKIEVDLWFDELLVNLSSEYVSSSFRKLGSTVTVTDQYGDPVNGEVVKFTADYDKLDGKANGATLETGSKGIIPEGMYGEGEAYDYDDGEAYYYFNGDNFKYWNDSKEKYVAADNVKFTASLASNSKVKTTLTIKTGTPELDKDGSLDIEGWNLEAKDNEVKISEAADGTTKESKIRLYRTSNNLQIGYETDAKLLTKGSDLLKDKKGEFSIKSSAATVGDIYVVVYNPDGEALELSTDGGLGIYQESEGKYKVVAAKATEVATDTSIMTYLKTGTYTVKVHRVTKLDKDLDEAAKLSTMVKTFEVTNSTKAISLKEQEYIDLSGDKFDVETVEEAIFAAFNFKFGSDKLNEPDDDSNIYVLDYKARYNDSSNNLFIYNVTFAVPLNNEDDTVYFKYKVDINRAVTVSDDFKYVE